MTLGQSEPHCFGQTFETVKNETEKVIGQVKEQREGGDVISFKGY